jgi:hypothetical protein
MKYLEELDNGSIFSLDNNRFILSSDFRIKNKIKQKMCISLINGSTQWFDDNSMVEYIDLYYRDIDGNILPIKSIENNDHTKYTHIS